MSSDELFLSQLLAALAAVKLEALVVGSAAAVLQGAPVMTQDVDLLVGNTQRNREKLHQMLAGGRGRRWPPQGGRDLARGCHPLERGLRSPQGPRPPPDSSRYPRREGLARPPSQAK